MKADPDGYTLVAESGIFTHGDVERLGNAGASAFLVGESLMRSLQELSGLYKAGDPIVVFRLGDDAVSLAPPRRMSLEEALEFLEDDELLEVTPQTLRLRKRILDANGRRKAAKQPK